MDTFYTVSKPFNPFAICVLLGEPQCWPTFKQQCLENVKNKRYWDHGPFERIFDKVSNGTQGARLCTWVL